MMHVCVGAYCQVQMKKVLLKTRRWKHCLSQTHTLANSHKCKVCILDMIKYVFPLILLLLCHLLLIFLLLLLFLLHLLMETQVLLLASSPRPSESSETLTPGCFQQRGEREVEKRVVVSKRVDKCRSLGAITLPLHASPTKTL